MQYCPLGKIVSTHCDYHATAHLIYAMGNCYIQLKNCLIQHKFQMIMIIFLKVPINKVGLSASFYSVDFKSPRCFIQKILAKQKESSLKWSGGPSKPHKPLHTQGKILKNEALSLTGSSIQEQGAPLKSLFYFFIFCPQMALEHARQSVWIGDN